MTITTGVTSVAEQIKNKGWGGGEWRRGFMWDGNFHAVPRINDYASATLQCTKLEDLDLSSDALNASLCHILQVWDLCLTK